MGVAVKEHSRGPRGSGGGGGTRCVRGVPNKVLKGIWRHVGVFKG